MNDIHTKKTIVPRTYRALEAEQYRAIETRGERQTEPPPAPPVFIWRAPPPPRVPSLVRLPWGVK